jgi:hypothetical protein
MAKLPMMSPPMLIRPILTRRHLLLAAPCVLFAVPAIAAEEPPLAFMTSIYEAYKGKDAKGLALDSPQKVRRYFEPSLAALINKDQQTAARRREVGRLDGDPFIDAQDWDISGFDISVSDVVGGKAKATVKFTNAGQAATVALDLVRVKNDWRISDITWLRDGKPQTLRGLLSH